MAKNSMSTLEEGGESRGEDRGRKVPPKTREFAQGFRRVGALSAERKEV